MSIDRAYLGYAYPPFIVTVQPQRLANFQRAIGEPTAAQTSPAPLTFMKVIEGEDGSSQKMLATLGVQLRSVLHAEQHFEYLHPICAGDRITVTRTVTDLYEKKGGAMEFIVIQSEFAFDGGALAGRSRQVILVRNALATS
jgi:hypothetical protein